MLRGAAPYNKVRALRSGRAGSRSRATGVLLALGEPWMVFVEKFPTTLYSPIQVAKVAELADAPDLGSGGLNRGGSSPPFRTNKLGPIFDRPFFTFVPRFLSGHRSS